MSSLDTIDVVIDRNIDFGAVQIDNEVERVVYFENNGQSLLSYRVSNKYILDNIDRVFKVSIENSPVSPGKVVKVKILFRPNNVNRTFTEYYIVDDTDGNFYYLAVTGKCYGPRVFIRNKKIVFKITKQNFFNDIQEEVVLTNKSICDAPYQWILPSEGRGYFEMTSGLCGVIRSMESIKCTIMFTGNALGVYAAEFVCLVLHQKPLFLNVLATVSLNSKDCSKERQEFNKSWKTKCAYTHLMENSLKLLSYIPFASVHDRYLDFGIGSVSDVTLNISKTLCVTNHGVEEGFIQWMLDPENIFQIDPILLRISPKESSMFTVRFRPKKENERYSFMLFGDCQHHINNKVFHTWFRVPCIGNTIPPCTEWPTEFHCSSEIVLPPTVPWRTTFTNFMLSNNLDVKMHFKLEQPDKSNFVIMPMCGLIENRGWQIISVALQPMAFGDYYENWHLVVNNNTRVRITFTGNAEDSKIQVACDENYYIVDCSAAAFEFPPTVTGCINSVNAYLHNPTRMDIQHVERMSKEKLTNQILNNKVIGRRGRWNIKNKEYLPLPNSLRVINTKKWLGADQCGSIVIPPRGVIQYKFWFYPTMANKIYSTTLTCSCATLLNGVVAGVPSEVFVQITGFSELSDLKVLPRTLNLHDIVVGNRVPFSFTLYNSGTCHVTSRLSHVLKGMDDDFSGDTVELYNNTISLLPCHHSIMQGSVVSNSAGPRQIDINYTVIYSNETEKMEELIPVKKTVCTIWYDGIYPTMQVKRTISVSCPITLTNHCAWNILNVDALNEALLAVRPGKPRTVNLYAPDLCVGSETVQMILVLGSTYQTPVEWSLARQKICDCEMTEVQIGISLYTMKHNCIHRELVELYPNNDTVFPKAPCLIYLNCKYKLEGKNILRYKLSMSNDRVILLDIHVTACSGARGTLVPLRRPVDREEYLAVLDCGKVPINNLDPVVRIVWLYNPTNNYTTWRFLYGNNDRTSSEMRCLLFFAEVSPLGRLGIPFAFMPTEMIDYEFIFYCSFGYDILKILLRGQGGLPNCIETRLDIPKHVEKHIRKARQYNTVHLSREHITIPVLPTHSLTREVLAINNDTEHTVRFIWLPEKLPNILNIIMTPSWGAVGPNTSQWITMTIYTLQEPATFTITVSCELLDLTERSEFQRNETLRKKKLELCNQQFTITEHGTTSPDINDEPPLVLDLKKPEPKYLALSVSISSKGQRDGYTRMNLRQLKEQVPAYDLHSSDPMEYERSASLNNISAAETVHMIDCILWNVLHSKMFNHNLDYYGNEHMPIYEDLMKAVDEETKPELSKRVTAGICDAIVNKAVYRVYGLNPNVSILDF